MNDMILAYIRKKFELEFPAYRFLWRHERESHGDVEMEAPILEAFDVPSEKHRELVRFSRALRKEAEQLLEKKMLLGSHTPQATRKYYAEMLKRVAEGEGALQEGLEFPNTIAFPLFQHNGLAIFGQPCAKDLPVKVLELK
jgi:hypothetical protein